MKLSLHAMAALRSVKPYDIAARTLRKECLQATIDLEKANRLLSKNIHTGYFFVLNIFSILLARNYNAS